MKLNIVNESQKKNLLRFAMQNCYITNVTRDGKLVENLQEAENLHVCTAACDGSDKQLASL